MNRRARAKALTQHKTRKASAQRFRKQPTRDPLLRNRHGKNRERRHSTSRRACPSAGLRPGRWPMPKVWPIRVSGNARADFSANSWSKFSGVVHPLRRLARQRHGSSGICWSASPISARKAEAVRQGSESYAVRALESSCAARQKRNMENESRRNPGPCGGRLRRPSERLPCPEHWPSGLLEAISMMSPPF